MKDNESQEPVRKLPEFIIIDQNETIEDLGSTKRFETEDILDAIPLTNKKQPFYFRIFGIFGTLTFAFIALLILFFAIFYFALSLVLFRQSSLINKQTRSTWNFFKKMVVFALGCFVMIFNLSFGLGIILIYFMLKGEDMKNSIYHKFYENMHN